MLVHHGVLDVVDFIECPGGFATRELYGDVYIDDLVLLVVGALCAPPDSLLRRLERADCMYADLGLPVKKAKSADCSLVAEFWGAELRGQSGLFGFPLERRALFTAATMCALAYGISGFQLTRLLGV